MKIRVDIEIKKESAHGRNYSADEVADQLIEEIEGQLRLIYVGDTEYEVTRAQVVYNEGNDPAANVD